MNDVLGQAIDNPFQRRKSSNTETSRNPRGPASSAGATERTNTSRVNIFPLLQLIRGILKALIFEQPAHQFLARICPSSSSASSLPARQKHARLDVDQRSGHDQKFAGDIETEESASLPKWPDIVR